MRLAGFQLFDDTLRRFFNMQSLERAVSVIAILIVGYVIISVVLALSRRLTRRRLRPRIADIAEKIIKYGGVLVVLVNASEAAGFDLSAALGAAGIVGIAIGFAAQTSVSNIISGLFLFSEKTFEIGDVIQIDAMSGTIESVDMLSVKIRTFDNRLVRIPNETMIKANMVNVTRWPERRLDITLTLPYGTDPTIVEAMLRDTAMAVPAALSEPEPFFVIDTLGPNGITFQFGVWFRKNDYLALKNALLGGILARFEKTGLRPSVQIVSIIPASEEGPAKPRGAATRTSDGKKPKLSR